MNIQNNRCTPLFKSYNKGRLEEESILEKSTKKPRLRKSTTPPKRRARVPARSNKSKLFLYLFLDDILLSTGTIMLDEEKISSISVKMPSSSIRIYNYVVSLNSKLKKLFDHVRHGKLGVNFCSPAKVRMKNDIQLQTVHTLDI